MYGTTAGCFKKRQALVFLIVAFIISAAVFLPFAYTSRRSHGLYSFEVKIASSADGMTQVYYDMGKGINEPESFAQTLEKNLSPKWYHYPLPIGRLHALRFDFNNRPGRYEFTGARIVNCWGRILYTFHPNDYHADSQIKELTVDGEKVVVATTDPADDPYVYLNLSRSLKLRLGPGEFLYLFLRYFIAPFFGLIALGAMIDYSTFKARHAGKRMHRIFFRNPYILLSFCSLLSVGVQLHPILFLGKSFVSPNITFLLYDRFPTVPGYKSIELEDQKGSDVAALIYQHFHFPLLERLALFTHHELPLWNRYDLAGTPLLGQGQTMFGELLNFIPMLAGNAAWAWDLKFVLARWVFAVALGIFVFRATGDRSAAGLIATVAPWIGYFSFRANHPAQFSVCFAPLILVAWSYLETAQGRRNLYAAAGLLFLANWEVLTSGTVKEAYMIILCLNFAGLLYLFAQAKRRSYLPQIICAVVTGAILILISAPLWWVFLDTLAESTTSYDVPIVYQIPYWQFIGVFEDMFYRSLNPQEIHGNPSTNGFILLGFAWLVSSVVFRKSRVGIAIICAAVVPAALAFGLIPAGILLKTPFLAHIYHIGNTFSCPLLVLLIAGAGVGVADFLKICRQGVHWPTAAIAFALIGLCWGGYFIHSWDQPRSLFFISYIVSLLLGVLGLLLILRLNVFIKGGFRWALIFGCGCVILWRYGTYGHIRFDEYVFNPPVRADLYSHSEAMDAVSALEKEPSRVAGLGMNLYCGAQQLYLQEGIYGIEAVRNGLYDALGVAVGLPKMIHWGSADFGGERSFSRGAMDMLNVKYYLDNVENHLPVDGLTDISSSDLRIFESKTVWPRAFYTNKMFPEISLAKLAARLNESHGVPFAAFPEEEWLHLSKLNLLSNSREQSVVSPARDYKLTMNTTSFTVDVDGPGVIVLSETYYPLDFIAYLNDTPVEYLRVNHAFKAIPVDKPGTYEVRFEYWPHHLTQALYLFAAGVIAALLLLIFPIAMRSPEGSVKPG